MSEQRTPETRTVRIGVRLTESAQSKLMAYADELNIAYSTVAAQILCERLRQWDIEAKTRNESVKQAQLGGMKQMADFLANDENLLRFAVAAARADELVLGEKTAPQS